MYLFYFLGALPPGRLGWSEEGEPPTVVAPVSGRLRDCTVNGGLRAVVVVFSCTRDWRMCA